MAFIDIFNFKKYFATPSDSQVARYGHINALASRITSPGTVTQTIDNNTDVTLNSYVGVVTLNQAILQSGVAAFNVFNSYVTENSVVLITVEYSSGADIADNIVYGTTDVVDGGFGVRVKVTASTQGGTVGPVKVHFLVIN